MDELSKKLRADLRRLAGKAHEEELRRALMPLFDVFEKWQKREMDSFELSDLIHEFHQGPSRDIFVAYADRIAGRYAVARAIAAGILDRKDVSAELMEHLAPEVAMYEADARRNGKCQTEG